MRPLDGMIMTLTLDDKHIYRNDGIEIPSVTQILKAEGFLGWQSGDEYYLLRGQYVHEAIRQYFKGTLDIDALLEGVRPYVDSAIEYITVTRYKPEHVELSLFSFAYKYAGTPDVWPLRDWKTGGKKTWHILQIAAYYMLAQENNELFLTPSILPMNVYLRPDGKMPKCEPYTISQLLEGKKVFLSALACYNWKKNNGLIKENKS